MKKWGALTEDSCSNRFDAIEYALRLFHRLANGSNHAGSGVLRRHDSVDLQPQKLSELAREVDISDARELVYEFFSIEDRGIV